MAGKWWYVVFGISEDGHSILHVGKYDQYERAYAYCESMGWVAYTDCERWTLKIECVCEPVNMGKCWLDDVRMLPMGV